MTSHYPEGSSDRTCSHSDGVGLQSENETPELRSEGITAGFPGVRTNNLKEFLYKI